MNRLHQISVLLPLLSGFAWSTEFHVSPAGDDANSGTPAAMLRTISEAANRAQPGDTVTVHSFYRLESLP